MSFGTVVVCCLCAFVQELDAMIADEDLFCHGDAESSDEEDDDCCDLFADDDGVFG